MIPKCSNLVHPWDILQVTWFSVERSKVNIRIRVMVRVRVNTNICSITQKQMIRKCSKLVQEKTLGYPTSGMVLGVERSKVKLRVRVSNNTAWVRTL